MNINAQSIGSPSYSLLASQSPVSCNSEKVRFSDALHAPASRRPHCRCRSRWLRASVWRLLSSSALWPGLSSRVGAPRASSDAPITFPPEDQRRMASVFSASGLNDAQSSAAFTGRIYSNFLPFFVREGGREGGRVVDSNCTSTNAHVGDAHTCVLVRRNNRRRPLMAAQPYSSAVTQFSSMM